LRPNADSIDALLAQIGVVEPCSWKGEQGIGVFSPDNADAIIEALRALAFEDRVRVAPPEHEGRCVSYRLGLLEQGRLHDYNLVFLPNYARLLLDEWLRWELDDGWRWINDSRVSRRHSRHPLHERMSDQVEHRRWRFDAPRPGGLAFGIDDALWRRPKRRAED
jgi:hypothetical protein